MDATAAIRLWNDSVHRSVGVDENEGEISQLTGLGGAILAKGATYAGLLVHSAPQFFADRQFAISFLREWADAIESTLPTEHETPAE
jgi:hypothetical protein